MGARREKIYVPTFRCPITQVFSDYAHLVFLPDTILAQEIAWRVFVFLPKHILPELNQISNLRATANRFLRSLHNRFLVFDLLPCIRQSQQQHFCSEEEAPFMFFFATPSIAVKMYTRSRDCMFLHSFFLMLDLSISVLPQTFQTLDFSSPPQPPASPPTSPYNPHIVDRPPHSSNLPLPSVAQFAPLPSQPPPTSTPALFSVAIYLLKTKVLANAFPG